jgi:hypothetical protein
MNAQSVARVFIKGNKSNIPFLLAVLKAMYSGMSTHAQLFTAIPIPITTFQSQIQALDTWQQNVKEKVPGAVAQRTIARNTVYATAETYRAYVESLCADSPEQAAALAQAAGLKLAAASTRAKPILAARGGLQSGEVVLSANGSLLHKGKGQRFFNWQYTLDGKTFVSVPSTPKTKTTIAGLPALATVGFRVSVTTSAGQQEWSQVVSLLVR